MNQSKDKKKNRNHTLMFGLSYCSCGYPIYTVMLSFDKQRKRSLRKMMGNTNWRQSQRWCKREQGFGERKMRLFCTSFDSVTFTCAKYRIFDSLFFSFPNFQSITQVSVNPDITVVVIFRQV